MPTPPAYAGTDVPVERSQEELRRLLRRFGAEQFTFGEGADWVGVEFARARTRVRLKAPMDYQPTDADVAAHNRRLKATLVEAREALVGREHRRLWRVLVWAIKARVVCVEEGVETFEQAFLPHLVDPGTGETVWEQARAAVEAGAFAIDGPGLLALTAGRR